MKNRRNLNTLIDIQRKSLIVGSSIFLSLFLFSISIAKEIERERIERPKLVIGIVVDQMRWDYLYRYYDRYTEKGFKRLIHEGFSCNNTFINHLPSATAVGHATIYTGSVPAIHGIVGNEWVDQLSGRAWYCTEDTTVYTIGADGNSGRMSPRNLLTTTVGDELRLAQNFRNKTIGVSLKDRAAILPAGHTATAAFWFDDKGGNFISSSYYMDELPSWVRAFNEQRRGERLVANNWSTLYPISTYKQSSADNVPWEGMLSGASTPTFPYELASVYQRKAGVIRATPFGNTLITEFAQEAVKAYGLGKSENTDLLTINYASTDYVGHMYGVNSIEIEDTYLRLDQDIANLLGFLDSFIGKDEYLVFLTADHGASPSKGFMDEYSIPTGYWDVGLEAKLNKMLLEATGVQGIVREDGKIGASYQVNFNHEVIRDHQLDVNQIKNLSIGFLLKQKGIASAVDIANTPQASVVEPIKTSIINSYHVKRSGAIQIVPDPGWMPSYSQKGTTHGSWNPYDTHIPLIFMGAGIKAGSTNRVISMVDIAPTLSAILNISLPNGNVGVPIQEVVN